MRRSGVRFPQATLIGPCTMTYQPHVVVMVLSSTVTKGFRTFLHTVVDKRKTYPSYYVAHLRKKKKTFQNQVDDVAFEHYRVRTSTIAQTIIDPKQNDGFVFTRLVIFSYRRLLYSFLSKASRQPWEAGRYELSITCSHSSTVQRLNFRSTLRGKVIQRCTGFGNGHQKRTDGKCRGDTTSKWRR